MDRLGNPFAHWPDETAAEGRRLNQYEKRAVAAERRARAAAAARSAQQFIAQDNFIFGMSANELSRAPSYAGTTRGYSTAPTKAQAAPSSFSYGFNLGDRSALDGVTVSTKEKIGRVLGESWAGFKRGGINLYNGLTGAESFKIAAESWQAGNYGTSVIFGARGVSEVLLTVSSFGTSSGFRTATMSAQELAAVRASYSETSLFGNAGSGAVDLATSRGTWGGLPATPAAQGFTGQLVRPGDMVPLPRGSMGLQDLGSLASSEGAEFAVIRLNGDRYIVRGTANTTTIPEGSTLIGHVHPGEGFMGLAPSIEDMGALGLLNQRRSAIFNESGAWRTFGPNGPSSSVFMPKPKRTPGN